MYGQNKIVCIAGKNKCSIAKISVDAAGKSRPTKFGLKLHVDPPPQPAAQPLSQPAAQPAAQ